MTTLQLYCSRCHNEVDGIHANSHLRFHGLNDYKIYQLNSSEYNIREMFMSQMIAAFNDTYADIKYLLKSQNLSLQLLPSLDIHPIGN